jgi:hypothetical protein
MKSCKFLSGSFTFPGKSRDMSGEGLRCESYVVSKYSPKAQDGKHHSQLYFNSNPFSSVLHENVDGLESIFTIAPILWYNLNFISSNHYGSESNSPSSL